MFTPYTSDDTRSLSPMKGSPFTPAGVEWERGYIHDVHPDRYCCDVYTERGRFLVGVAWPNNSGGEVMVPKRGAAYAVVYTMGVPVLIPVDACAQQPTAAGQAINVTPVSGIGGDDAPYAGRGNNSLRGSQPADVLPGDWLRVGSLGNLVGVLEGGSVVLKASDLAQVIATQSKNMLRLIGQNFSLYTGAGTLDFETKEGKTSMILRAGADAETESNPTEDNFRIRCELGDAGEMVDFRVTDGYGRALYRLHVDPDGRMETSCAQRVSVTDGSAFDFIDGDHQVGVGGNTRDITDGDRLVETGQNREDTTGGSHRISAGNDMAVSALHDLLLTSIRNMEMRSTGDVTGSDPSLLFTVANGDVQFKIGDPRAGDAQVRRSGFHVDTVSGAISMNSVTGKIDIGTPVPGGTKIGGAPGVGPYSAVLFEALEMFLGIFGSMIDNHVHFHPSLGFTPTNPPFLPPYAWSKGSLRAAKSTFVKLGG